MKVLLISYNFLQFYNPSSIQARRFFIELANREISITVITNKDKKNIKFSQKNIEIIEVSSIGSNLVRKICQKLNIYELNFLPDWNSIFWNPFVIIRLLFLKNKKFDLVHTISSPSSTHLIPLLWGQREFKFWIAQFYDPWVDNSYIKFRLRFFLKVNEYLERKVLENANVIAHTNRFIEEVWLNRYGDNFRNKKLVLPLTMESSFKISKVKIPQNSIGNTIIISHIGSIYGRRNLDTIFSTLKKLNKKYLKNIKINLVGEIEKKILSKIKSNEFSYLFKIHGSVSYEKSLEFMRTSDVLLLIEEDENLGLFFPSKITDYLRFDIPILGILPQNCISREILSDNGHDCFSHSEIVSISKYMSNLIENKENFNKILNGNLDNLKVKNVVDAYIREFNLQNENKF